MLLALFFVFAGAMHFVRENFYLMMMPPYIPFPLLMIHLSGIAEIVLGLLVLPARTRRFAGFGLIALLIAVFPANIYAAQNPEVLPGIPPALLWTRLPFQLLFIAWVWAAALRPSR